MGAALTGEGRAPAAGRLLILLISAFGVFGLQAGCNAVLLADLTQALGISPGPLGGALFAGAAASIATMAALGWAADRLGRKAFLLAVICAFGLGIAGLSAAGSFVTLILALVVYNSAGGLYDVGINAAAVDLEGFSRRRFMSFLHAAYSGGAVVGAVAAGALLSAGLGYRLIYLSLLLPFWAVALAFALARLPRPGAGAPSAGEVASPGEDTAESGDEAPGGAEGSRSRRWGLYRHGPLLIVAAIAALGLLSEGQMANWSGIYLRRALELPALVGGSGVAAFFGAMAVGRLATGWVVTRLGNRTTLLGAGLLAALGMQLGRSWATLLVGRGRERHGCARRGHRAEHRR